MTVRPSIYDEPALEAFRHRQRIDPRRIKRLRYKYFRMGEPRQTALAELTGEQRAAFDREMSLHCLSLVDRFDSQLDGASKLVFETAAGRRLETVVLRAPRGRTSVCVSSQVGCSAKCTFCATGFLPEAHSLTAAEMVDQVVQADRLVAAEQRRVRNIVFMGMGEPLHNEEQVAEAVEWLHRDDCLAVPLRRTVVSTVGVPEAMIRWAQRFRRCGLALSLHSVDPELRAQLIPLARKYSLQQLREALVEVIGIQRQPVLIEYLMLSGVNDSPADAEALGDYLSGLHVHVNLIPFNPIAEAPQFAPTPKAQRERFGASLRARGFTVTIRYSQGADIAAACGQLAKRPAS